MLNTMELLELNKKALYCMVEHRRAFGGDWAFGQPERAWYDENGDFCVGYQGGKWWHYREVDGNMEWW